MWQNTFNGVLGLVILAIAFIGLTGAALTWTLAITGLLIAIVGFSGSARHPNVYHEQQQRSTR